jgi:K+-sensing histidine kinase KdpD
MLKAWLEEIRRSQMFISVRRGIIAAVLALLLEFYAFNFIPRNISIMASRSPAIQKVDYLINFLIFFIVFYLVLTLAVWLSKKVTQKSK